MPAFTLQDFRYSWAEPKDTKWKIAEINQFSGFKLHALLRSVTKSHTAPRCPPQDVKQSFVLSVALWVVTSTVAVSQCLCSCHPFCFSITAPECSSGDAGCAYMKRSCVVLPSCEKLRACGLQYYPWVQASGMWGLMYHQLLFLTLFFPNRIASMKLRP